MSSVIQVPDIQVDRALPPELAQLLTAQGAPAREAAWARLLESYSRLLLYLARSPGAGYDTVMDRYAFIIERLSQDDFRRLRAYASNGRAKFSTWLAVVARRLCYDHNRQRYGRVRTARSARHNGLGEGIVRRRALANLVGGEIEVTALPDPNAPDPEATLCVAELRATLAAALRDVEPADRLLLQHWFEEGRSGPEIAAALGYPNSFHVYRRLRVICGRLRRRLEQGGIREAQP